MKTYLLQPFRFLPTLLALAVFSISTFGQALAPVVPEPRREQLLNGLKLLLVPRPTEPQVTFRLRIHSGAAFDLAGKEGMMALLGDALFSDSATADYVKEELEGRLEVTTSFDSIDVLLSGRADSFERLAELLRNALLNTQLTPEVVARLREARTKIVREVGISPATVADRAVAARLYGSYPYGRVLSGTPETLARIQRADLMMAHDRFLASDNATLVIIGGFDPVRSMRVLRQYLGGWRKSDRGVPATFRQPAAPDPRTLVIDMPELPDAEVRLALRGLPRADRDRAAAIVLALIAQERWKTATPELASRAVSVTHDAHALGGVFRLSASVPSATVAAQAVESARAVLRALASTHVGATEFETAKRAAAATLARELEKPETLADVWLDTQTYQTSAANTAETIRALNALTPAEAQRVAARLFVEQPVASVAVGEAAKLSAELARVGGVEVLGAAAASTEPAATEPAKPAEQRPRATIQLKRP
ncbi:MAG TPA: insulinase family protein [Pyrinomonadaceae bacterium]|nr:insulinase family protein [Pyrinomonadaceae bacterium]